jgi:heme o synthase
MMERQSPWQSIPVLLRCNLSLAVAAAALTGFLYSNRVPTWRAFAVFAGVFLLASAASALNQYQERRVDSLMERTRGRPLPGQRIGGICALLIALVTGMSGLFLLFFTAPPLAGGIALFTLVWYTGVYTPLKRKSRYAVFIGAIAGATAPMIGWAAAGGPVTVPCIVICLFMYLWQIAHFLLLQIRYGQEYERAGLPSLAASMNGERFGITVFVWILATAGGALLFPVFYVLTNTALMAALILGICLFVIYFHGILVRRKKEFNPAPAFRCMYLFQGFVFALLIAEGLLANSSFSPAGSPPVSSTLQALSSNSVRCSFFLNACAFLPLERWMNRKPQP